MSHYFCEIKLVISSYCFIFWLSNNTGKNDNQMIQQLQPDMINISPWDKLGDVHVCDQTSEKQEWCSDSSHFPTKKKNVKKYQNRVENL